MAFPPPPPIPPNLTGLNARHCVFLAGFEVLTLVGKGPTDAFNNQATYFLPIPLSLTGFEVLTLMEKVPTDDEDRPLQVGSLL